MPPAAVQGPDDEERRLERGPSVPGQPGQAGSGGRRRRSWSLRKRALPSIRNPQIIGVVSSSTKKSIRLYNDQDSYDKWLFFYGQDPEKPPEIIYYGQEEEANEERYDGSHPDRGRRKLRGKYGADLVREFRKLHPEAAFLRHRRQADGRGGGRASVPVEELTVMGIFEVISHVPRIRRIFRQPRPGSGLAPRPAAAVLIDSPDFNLRLARKLKKAGIPVLYYISPTVWAWRRGRLKTIRKAVARMMPHLPVRRKDLRGTRASRPSSSAIPSSTRSRPRLSRDEFLVRHTASIPERRS